jgi:hypothetical protein
MVLVKPSTLIPKQMGLVAAPDECYATLRSMRTVLLRLPHQDATAREVAHFLCGHHGDVVEEVCMCMCVCVCVMSRCKWHAQGTDTTFTYIIYIGAAPGLTRTSAAHAVEGNLHGCV